jgi:tetratricopeptide (TPR) repeat protein
MTIRYLCLHAAKAARHYEEAANLLQQQRAHVPAQWQAAWTNEEAALAWHRGQADEAAQLWRSQPESVPVLFNRGMAALFLARPAESRRWLSQAVVQLPETSAWHHLGRLYLALAEMRG